MTEEPEFPLDAEDKRLDLTVAVFGVVLSVVAMVAVAVWMAL